MRLEVRLQTSGGRDLTNVKKLQRAIRVVPLSVHTARGASVAVHAGSAPSEAVGGGTPAEQVAALDPKAFFTRFAQALQDNPAPADDAHAQELLGDIGVSAGYPVPGRATASRPRRPASPRPARGSRPRRRTC